MTKKRAKRVDKLHRALLALCRLQRRQITELGQLRTLMLEIRDARPLPLGAMRLDGNGRIWRANPTDFSVRRHSVMDPDDSPQPPLD